MKSLRLILKEIRFRKVNFGLSVLGVLIAVLLFVFFFTAGEASMNETTRLMRDLGMNLRIIPKSTDMTRFWSVGFSEETMPADYVERLATQKGLSFSHLLPTLKRKLVWNGREIVLVGIAPEVSPLDRKKPSMSFVLQKGTAFIGHQLAAEHSVNPGDEIELSGKRLRVTLSLPESGSDQDVSIFGALDDVQQIVGLPGRINEIQALDCVCLDPTKDSLQELRKELAGVLPDALVIQSRTIAGAREKQRKMIEDHSALVLPTVVVAAAIWVGLLALLNVRERWREIGILRAVGRGSGEISRIFLGRALIVGALGAVLGFALGTALALRFGPEVFKVTGSRIVPLYGLLVWSLVAAPLLAALASLVPTFLAVTQDPAVALRDE